MKKTIAIIAVFFLSCHAAFSQKRYQDLIDSLNPLLASAKEDTAKLNLLSKIMSAHIYYKTEEGLAYQYAALELANKLNWKPGQAKIKDRVGRLQWRMGNFPEALKNHFEAMKLYVEMGDKYAERTVLMEIGQDYVDGGKYNQAKAFLLKAIKQCEEAGDKLSISKVYDILSFLYSIQGNLVESSKVAYLYMKVSEETGDKEAILHGASVLAYSSVELGNNKEALKYFNQGLQASKQIGNKISEAGFDRGIGDFYLSQGNYPEAKKFYIAELALLNEIKDVPLLASVHHAMANLYSMEGKFTDALNNYLVADSEYKSVSNKPGLSSLYSDLGCVYTRLKKYELAKITFNHAKTLSDSLDNSSFMNKYYSGLELLDSATGNWKDAYNNYKKYIILRDSSFNKETLKKLVALQMQFENDKKQAADKQEQVKKDIVAQEEIKRQRNIKNSSFAVLAVVIIFSIVVYRQRNKIAGEKKRSDQLVADKEVLLKEIHHRVKNNLEVVSSLLALQSAQIDDPDTKEAILAGQNRVHSIGIVHQKLYQGENLGHIEMKDYFINLGESILDSFGVVKRVTIECAMDKLDVDIDTAVPLGLIVNELLTNTLKYAFPEGQDGKVQIKLQRQTGGILQLEVSDNGVGKSGLTHGTGFGGQLVSLLTQQLSGTIREEIKDGTHIYFEFRPVKAA